MSILGVMTMVLMADTMQPDIFPNLAEQEATGGEYTTAELRAEANSAGVIKFICGRTTDGYFTRPRCDIYGAADVLLATLTLNRGDDRRGVYKMRNYTIDSPNDQRLTVGNIREHMWVVSDRRTEDDGSPTIDVVQFGQHDLLPDYGMPEAIAAAGVAMRDERIARWAVYGNGWHEISAWLPPPRQTKKIDNQEAYFCGVGTAGAAVVFGPWTAFAYALACGMWADMDTW